MSYAYPLLDQRNVPLQPQDDSNVETSNHNFHPSDRSTANRGIREDSNMNDSSINSVNASTATSTSTIPTTTTTTTATTTAAAAATNVSTNIGTVKQATEIETESFARTIEASETSTSPSLSSNSDPFSSSHLTNDNGNQSSLPHSQLFNMHEQHTESQEQLEKSSKCNKVGKACDQCRFRKVKCDGEKPCSRCAKTSAACTYNYVFKMRKPTKRTPAISDTDKPKRKRGRPPKNVVTTPLPLHSNPSGSAYYQYFTDGNNTNNSTISQPNSQVQSSSADVHGYSTNNKQIPFLHNSNPNTPHILSNIPSIPPTPNMNPAFIQYSYKTNQIRQTNLPIGYNQASSHQFQSQISPPQTDFLNHQPNYAPATLSIQDNSNQQYYRPPVPLENSQLVTKSTDESNVENRLQKLETMLSVLIDKVSNSPNNNNAFTPQYPPSASSITSRSFPLNGNDSNTTNVLSNEPDDCENTADEVYDVTKADQLHGLFTHTAIFFLSHIGLISLENRMSDPKLLLPLKKILGIVSPCEERVMSIWKNPISETKLAPLPSREMISYLLERIGTCTSVLHLVDFTYLKKLYKLYCDHRDGIIPEPKFTYSDYFLMNTFLLIASEIVCEMIRTKTMSDEDFPGFSFFESHQDKLLDNAIFYYVRVSVISGGLLAISSSLLLSFYADCVSLSRAAYLISSSAIRQAQELGLHLEDTYRGLESKERNLRLNLWWTCYMIDKEMCIRWGHVALINDSDISAPPLPGFEAFWSPNHFENDIETLNGKEGEKQSMRSKRGIEIQAALAPFLENTSKAAILEQFVCVDYALLCSKIYHRFLRANAMKNMTRKKVNDLLADTLHELNCWRKNIPREIRPRNGEDDNEILDFINSMKEQNSRIALYKMYMATEFHVRYHHLRLMIHRAYIKNWILEFSEPFSIGLCTEQLVSARSILRLSFVVDANFGNFTNHFAFYPFHAFVLVCAFYVYSKKRLVEMESDFKLLIDCLNIHVREATKIENTNERSRHINYVLKAMLYATYHTCVTKFGSFDVPGLEALEDIKDIQTGVKTPGELVLIKKDLKKGARARPFCKMPYYENQNTSSATPNSVASDTIGKPNPARTPNVQFLLSPSQQPTVTPAYLEGMEFSKDNFFHNMLNIPNYFMDPLAED